MSENYTIVIFGGTGDLTKRKLVPAFAQLASREILGEHSQIIGIARGEYNNNSYKQMLIESVSDESEKKHISEINVRYFRGDVDDPESLSGLHEFIEMNEPLGGNNRIFYLATGFKIFPKIIREIKKRGLDNVEGKFTRIVFEKPFGSDLGSFTKIDSDIHDVFSEEQVYRIDHYLGKETVQNISLLKFTNPMFESVLNNEMVESIELIVDEDMGLDKRILSYDEMGAIKDMVQNHMLQVLALLLMEEPEEWSADAIHDKKVEILKNLEVMSPKNNLLGQYSSYVQELSKYGLKPSKTETFVKLSLNCNTPRWNGVQLFLRTGKKLERKYGQIKIKFKQAAECVKASISGIKDNSIVIDIYPKQDVRIFMNSRIPGKINEVHPISFDFVHESYFGPNTINEYTTLLEDVILGDKTLFTRSDELLESWRVIEQIEAIREKIPFVLYQDGGEPEKIVRESSIGLNP